MNEPRSYIYIYIYIYIYMGIFKTYFQISVSQTDIPLTQTCLSRLQTTSNLVTQVLTQCVYCAHMIPMSK